MRARILARALTLRGLRPWQRHSLVLAVAGCVYVGLGVVYLAVPSPDRDSGLRLVLHWAPTRVWALVFVAVGGLALVSTRWPPQSKTWGYTALSALSSLWGCAYLGGVLFFDAPSTYLTAGFVWGLIAFLWWAIAGLVNPDDLLAELHEAIARETVRQILPGPTTEPATGE